MELEIHQLDGGHAVATFGPVIMLVITTAPTDFAVIDELARLSAAVLQTWPMSALWIIVHHGAPFPNADVRRHIDHVIAPFRDRQCLVLSLLGLGFWASAAFAVSTGIAQLIGHRSLIMRSVQDGADRIGLELIGVDAEKLAALHDELLGAIQTRAS